MADEEFIYYQSDSDHSSEGSECQEYSGMSGGIRETKYVQAGNNNVTDPYHFNEMIGVASAGGRFNRWARRVDDSMALGGKKPKVGKIVAKVGKSVGKAVYKEAKPIIVAEGKKALKQGIKNMMASDDQEITSGAGFKRGRGRPRKNVVVDHVVVPMTQDGGKRSLGKKLGAMMPDDLIEEGFKRGIEYAKKMSGGKFKINPHSFGFKNKQEIQQQNKLITGGKFHIGRALKKVAGNEYAQDFASGAVGLGVGTATGNPIAGIAAGTGTKAGMTAATGGKRGGGKTRGAIVGKIMREKGLSLPAASKYVKEHNLY